MEVPRLIDLKVFFARKRLEQEMLGIVETHEIISTIFDKYQKAANQTGFTITVLSDTEGDEVPYIGRTKVIQKDYGFVLGMSRTFPVEPYVTKLRLSKGNLAIAIEKPQGVDNHVPFWDAFFESALVR